VNKAGSYYETPVLVEIFISGYGLREGITRKQKLKSHATDVEEMT
jgi:hypothetical protein